VGPPCVGGGEKTERSGEVVHAIAVGRIVVDLRKVRL
jgi:hypothetical protein